MPQNYKNHRQYIPSYHMLLLPLILVCLVISVYELYIALFVVKHGRLVASGLFLLSDVALAMFFFNRGFALKAQDRAIRAEENLRHFALTGRLLDKRLRTGQIIALRFADDTEFLILSEKAANENMKPNEIKKAIINWKADHYRV
ncbi:MAG: DUF6526 family protein [Ginsengibacter sp.]